MGFVLTNNMYEAYTVKLKKSTTIAKSGKVEDWNALSYPSLRLQFEKHSVVTGVCSVLGVHVRFSL